MELGDPRLTERARSRGGSLASKQESPPRHPPPRGSARTPSFLAAAQRLQSVQTAPSTFSPTGSDVGPPLLPKGHRAPRNRTCRRPEVLPARSSSSGLPAPGLGSKIRETSPARMPPCCWLVSGRNLGAHFRPLSGTTREAASWAGRFLAAFQRLPESLGGNCHAPRPWVW